MKRWWVILGGSGLLGACLFLLGFWGLVSGLMQPGLAFSLSAWALVLGVGGMAAFTWAMTIDCLRRELPGDLRLAYLALIVGCVPVGAVIYSVQRARLSRSP